MAAIIKTYLNGDPTTLVEGASRDDLRPGDVVTCEASAAPGGEYRWTLAFAPMDEAGAVKSAATVDGQETSPQCSFTVDHEGAYLVRLIIDPGTATESAQFVRLRFLTRFGSLKLVAAGERRDGSGIVPVDATTEGWANDQNYNLQELLHHISRTAISSRTVYVDANRGNDPTNGQNTVEAEGYADFWKIQDAIDHCVAGGHCGVPASPEHPWFIVVRPGLYRESLTIHSGVILWGDPSGTVNSEVIVRTEDTDAQLPGVHHVELPNAGDMAQVFGIHFVNFDTADTEGVLRVSGVADASFILAGSWVEQRGNSATQGPCVGSLQPRLKILESKLESSALTNSDRFAVTLSGADASIVDSEIQGASGISADASSSIQVRKSRIRVEHPDASAAGIRTWGRTGVLGTVIDVGASDGWAVDVNPTGTAGNRIVVSHSSLVSLSESTKGGLRYNTTGVADPGVHLASVDLPRLVFDPPEFVDDARVTHGTTGESLFYKTDKEVHTSSLSTGNLPADSVQQALDKLLRVAIQVATLDDAYDGLLDHSTDPPTRGSGHGHQIVADATDALGRGIPVSIVDKTSPDDFAGAANSKGRLQVVSNVEVGAIDAPEIDLDPNPFGAGPRVSFGKTVWPGGSHKAAAVVQASSAKVLGRYYHLRLQTQASNLAGPGYIGSVVVQGGDSFGPADGGAVHIQSGSSDGGTPGSVFIASGESSLVVAGSGSTGAVLTAANACADPVGLQEDLFLSTPAGSFKVSVNPGLTPAQVASAINLASAGSVTAVVTGGGELELTTNATGPLADVLLVTASAQLNTALGDLTAAAVTYVDGAYGDTFTVRTTDDNELTLGIGGAVGPMVYNADTGKLTVPGLIDPWGLIFAEVDHTLVDDAGIHPTQGEGAVFVSNGAGGLIDNHPHYRGEDDGAGVEQDPLAFVLSDGTGNATEVAFWSADGVLAGDENLWWDAVNGRLGVGTDAPATPLHVVGNVAAESGTGTLNLDVDGAYAGNMGLWADGSHLVVGSQTNNDFFVFLNGLETLQLTRGASWTKYTSHGGGGTHFFSGNVGIGVDSATEPLHVVGNGLFTGNVTVNGDLVVQGDQTTMNTSTVLVEDKNIEIGVIDGGGETDVSADGGGITLKGDTDKTITWDLATGAWHFNQGINIQSSADQLRIGSSLTEYATLGVDGATGLAVESVGGPILVTSAGNLTLDSAASLNLNTQSNDATHAINLGTENKPGPVNIATNGTRDLNLGTTTTTTTVQGDPITLDSAGQISLNAAGYIAVTSSAALHLETNSHTHDINLGAENKNSPINIGTGGTRAITMSSANSEVIINGPASGSGKALTVNGDVKITGVLDPTAVVITHQAAGPMLAVGESSLWVDDSGAVKFYKRLVEGDATTGTADGLALSSELTTLQSTVSAMTDTLPPVTGGDNGSTLLVVGGAWSVGSASGLVDGVASGDLLSWDGAAWIASSLTTDGVLGALAVLPGIAEGNILKVVDDGAGNLSWAAGADEEGSEDGHVHAQYATGAELASHTHDYIATSHVVNAIVATDISNWTTAHGWGDHAGLYSAAAHNHDSAYAAAAHNHDSAYAAAAHAHGVDDLSDARVDTPAYLEITELTASNADGILILRVGKVGAAGDGDEVQLHQLANNADPLFIEANGEHLGIEYPAGAATLQEIIDGINAVAGWAALPLPGSEVDTSNNVVRHPSGPTETDLPVGNGGGAAPGASLHHVAGEWVPLAPSSYALASHDHDYLEWGASGLTMEGHILPDTNAVYDIGSAEFKIRHLFLSDNSLWIGDSHKTGTKKGGRVGVKKRKGAGQAADWIPSKLDMRLHQFLSLPGCPLVSPTQLSGAQAGNATPNFPDGSTLESWGAGVGVNDYTAISPEAQLQWRGFLLGAWCAQAAGYVPSMGSTDVNDRSTWTLGDWHWTLLMSSILGFASAYVSGWNYDHDAGALTDTATTDVAQVVHLFSAASTMADDGLGGSAPNDRNVMLRGVGDIFDEDADFEGDPDIIEVRQYLPIGAGATTTTVVAPGDCYVGIETESAAASLGLDAGVSGFFSCYLPDTEAEGAVQGRRVIISNESDPTSGDTEHFPITISVRNGAGALTGKVSGMDSWDIPMMTAMTLVCVGGEGAACKWFITGRS